LAAAIIRDSDDKSKCYLLFANRTEYDILMMSELDLLAEKHPNQFCVYHTLSRPYDPKAWAETGHFTGYVTTEMMSKIFPKGGPNSGNIALLCGPKGFTDDTCSKALKAIGYPENMIVTY
jgi:NAD(P)H-flavin reductase